MAFCPFLQKEPPHTGTQVLKDVGRSSVLILCLVLEDLLLSLIVVRIKYEQMPNERTCKKQNICKHAMLSSFPV